MASPIRSAGPARSTSPNSAIRCGATASPIPANGEPGRDGERHPGGQRQPAEDGGDEGGQDGGVRGAGGEQHGAVPAPVGEPADDRAAEGLAEPERGRDGAGVADAVAFVDEQKRSDGAQRGGQPGEEREDGQGGTAECGHPAETGCGFGRHRRHGQRGQPPSARRPSRVSGAHRCP
ncbi:hypothetical protein [Streptomyces sp. ISL-86]|uniref:hypothetical protein n=1 Tax=Streptomyces sp. ISL-86 TaxID=2819187 RepID=UPI001BE5948E|nr:hypothetical protein [Streptomyces sp. ISL-86]